MCGIIDLSTVRTVMLCYCYLIGWSSLNLWYYGCRYSKKAKPEDLWVTYFTSSKFVAEARAKYGEPDVIQIRRTFDSQLAARKWEATVCRRLNVRDDPKWINKHNGGGDFLCTHHTEETRLKIAKANTGRITSEESRKRMSEAQKALNKTLSKETRELIAASRRGKPGSNKGKKFPIETLDKCQKEYEFLNPDGEIVKVRGLIRWCEKMGLKYESMKRVYNQDHLQHQGWTANPPKQAGQGAAKTWGFVKDGEVVVIVSLLKFCKENNLSLRSMTKVYNGEQKMYEGYTQVSTGYLDKFYDALSNGRIKKFGE